eukprot:178114-Hanusia_phi.AAC.1
MEGIRACRDCTPLPGLLECGESWPIRDIQNRRKGSPQSDEHGVLAGGFRITCTIQMLSAMVKMSPLSKAFSYTAPLCTSPYGPEAHGCLGALPSCRARHLSHHAHWTRMNRLTTLKASASRLTSDTSCRLPPMLLVGTG